MWSLHGLPVSVWVPSGYHDFLPQSKDMQGDSKLPVGVNVNGCWSLFVSPVMNWRLVQDVPALAQRQLGLAPAPLQPFKG